MRVQFNTEDFHCRNRYGEEILWNFDYSLVVFQFIRNQACLRDEDHFHHLVQHEVKYTVCVMCGGSKPDTLAVHLVSASN